MSRRSIAILAPLLLIMYACSEPDPTPVPAPAPAPVENVTSTPQLKHAADQHFIFNNGAEPETLDPALATGVTEHRLLEGLFEGLVCLHPATLAPEPGVAKSWDISEDGLVYTFHLRDDAKWSDGKAVTAKDFSASWQRVLTATSGAEYAYQLFPVKNAEAFLRGDITDFAEVGVETIDDHTLRVTLHAPCPYFLDLCAFGTLAPVRMDVIQRHAERWTRPEHIITNGAFTLKAWVQRERVEMVPNEHYWDRENVSLARITAYPFDDLDAAYSRYEAGGMQWLSAVPIGKIEEVKRHPDYYVAPYLGSYFYRFNCTRPPFDNPTVRKALSLAVDRSVITDHILKGGQIPATWFCPTGTGDPGYQPVSGLAHDVTAARAALAEAGYPDGKGLGPIELLYNNSESHKMVAENIAQQWNQALGIQVSLRNLEWQVYLRSMNALDYQVMRSGWIGDYNDPNTFFDMFVTDGGNNRTGWSNARYDELVRLAATERDPAARLGHFQEMERLLIEEEFPIMPIYIYVNQGLISEKVQGWHENVRDYHPLKYIWISE